MLLERVYWDAMMSDLLSFELLDISTIFYVTNIQAYNSSSLNKVYASQGPLKVERSSFGLFCIQLWHKIQMQIEKQNMLNKNKITRLQN